MDIDSKSLANLIVFHQFNITGIKYINTFVHTLGIYIEKKENFWR